MSVVETKDVILPNTSDKSLASTLKEHTSTNRTEGEDVDEVYTHAEARAITHRVDRRIVSTLAALYMVTIVDRGNISFAAVAGLNQDLELQIGYRYSIVILTFFITYTILQPLGGVLTRKIGPRLFLGSITFAWGVAIIGNGFVSSWSTLAGLRALVGAFEAGYFPGAVYLLSTWYSRYDVGKRYTAFYGIGCVAAAFAGIVAYGLSQMNGAGGLAGWRWIFIIEGIMSCVVAVVSTALLVDFPEEADRSWKFLTRDERDYIIRRVNRDRADAITEPFSLPAFISSAKDLKIWIFAFMFFCAAMVSYSINYFIPIILVGMGFSIPEAQCLAAPPWAFTGITMFAEAWLSDRYRLRGPVIAFNAVLAMIGLVLVGFVENNGARYFGIFLVNAGSSGNIPSILTYQANNIRGHWKRAFCSATLTGFGGIGGIAGSLVFRSQDRPKYLPGIYASIAANVCLLTSVVGMSMWFWYCNRKASKGLMKIEGHQGFFYTF